MMPCNPSIGGTGKGQLVREIDALGGEMGLNIDKTFIQSRMLNRTKGPAVHSPRAQADKQRYHEEMKFTLEKQDNLDLRQGEVLDITLSESGDRATGVLTKSGAVYESGAVILATGTYLNALVHVSDRAWHSGPSGFTPSMELPSALEAKGIKLRRFKTGTPARVLGRSLDLSVMQEQAGDEFSEPFSFLNDEVGPSKTVCWLTWTNPAAHKIVAENIEKTAPYGGYTSGVGPRYCLSIEDKVSRFPERERHQVFLEPEGLSTDEVYVQGMSTSLPEAIQEKFYRSIDGMQAAEISRFGYSIEYDCIDPTTLYHSLRHRDISGLYFAGQINGSSGYEEAAAQGLIAGINAARSLDELPEWTPDRSEAYIGVLIDDLVSKGTEEPYRIMTSRAEFRLVLRQDNADLRLTEIGHELGLASAERYQRYICVRDETESEIERLKNTYVNASEANSLLSDIVGEGVNIKQGRISLAELLIRPEMDYDKLIPVDKDRPKHSARVAQQVYIQLKYAGYIAKQEVQIERFRKLEHKLIPAETDYKSMGGLRIEAAEKLSVKRPSSIGDASRISGVSPADINVLLVNLARLEAKPEKKR
jgi:tRNA uridine 5-carboxymethylaminomethyl modification enzyme